MPLPPDQALDESTHRKVEGSFDSLRLAARQVRSESDAIRAEGGEERLARLLEDAADEVTEILTRLMSAAYFGGAKGDGSGAPASKPKRPVKQDSDQGSLFEEPGDDTLAA
jgi:hypothetical protein